MHITLPHFIANVVAQRLWLEIGALWFRCLKSERHELQKSDTSLWVHVKEKLKVCWKSCRFRSYLFFRAVKCVHNRVRPCD